jgi:phage terminase large subunit GpA-like protein
MKKSPDLPNEALDCRIYARAALEQLGAATIGQLATFVSHYRAKTQQSAAPQQQPDTHPEPDPLVVHRPPERRRASGYVDAWRR